MPATATTEPRVYTTVDIAAMLKISRSNVYEQIRQGAIPGALRIGGHLRIDRRAFDEWYKELREEGR